MTSLSVPTQQSAELKVSCERIQTMSGSWADRLLASLRLVRDHQELVKVIGLKILSDCEFAAQAKIHAIFTGRRLNTVNYGFRTHLVPSQHALPREFSVGLLDWKNGKSIRLGTASFTATQPRPFRMCDILHNWE
jgi:hypothetical protein